MLARDGREGVQEFLDAVAAFEVVDEVAKGDASALEHRRAAEDVRIAVDDGEATTAR